MPLWVSIFSFITLAEIEFSFYFLLLLIFSEMIIIIFIFRLKNITRQSLNALAYQITQNIVSLQELTVYLDEYILF